MANDHMVIPQATREQMKEDGIANVEDLANFEEEDSESPSQQLETPEQMSRDRIPLWLQLHLLEILWLWWFRRDFVAIFTTPIGNSEVDK